MSGETVGVLSLLREVEQERQESLLRGKAVNLLPAKLEERRARVEHAVKATAAIIELAAAARALLGDPDSSAERQSRRTKRARLRAALASFGGEL